MVVNNMRMWCGEAGAGCGLPRANTTTERQVRYINPADTVSVARDNGPAWAMARSRTPQGRRASVTYSNNQMLTPTRAWGQVMCMGAC